MAFTPSTIPRCSVAQAQMIPQNANLLVSLDGMARDDRLQHRAHWQVVLIYFLTPPAPPTRSVFLARRTLCPRLSKCSPHRKGPASDSDRIGKACQIVNSTQ